VRNGSAHPHTSVGVFLVCLWALVPLQLQCQARYQYWDRVVLPDPSVTPGGMLTTDLESICRSGYSAEVRYVPRLLKREVCEEYEVAPERCTGEYVEIDHLIPLVLGGSNDKTNLWPQPYSPVPGAQEKDRVEVWLRKQVCDQVIPIEAAQRAIALNWLIPYAAMKQNRIDILTALPEHGARTLAPQPAKRRKPRDSFRAYVAITSRGIIANSSSCHAACGCEQEINLRNESTFTSEDGRRQALEPTAFVWVISSRAMQQASQQRNADSLTDWHYRAHRNQTKWCASLGSVLRSRLDSHAYSSRWTKKKRK
jgi:hypothetical protein